MIPSDTHQILIVDDDPVMRLLVRNALEPAGFTVLEAEDGPAALSLFESAHPEIVLLDVLMPGMDGFAICTALRKLPDGARTPIIMLTALEDFESIQRAYETGATDFITKPINWTILGQRMRYMMRATHAANKLSRSEAKNQALIEAIPDLMFRMSKEGVFLEVKESKDIDLPVEPSRVPGESICNVMPPEIAQPAIECVRKALETKLTQVYEYHRSVNDTLRYYEARIVASGEDEVVGIVRDMTEQKQMEKELRTARDELEVKVRERTAELEKANTALRESEKELRLLTSKLISVQEEERRRLASELHDSIGQTLAALKFGVETVLDARDKGDTRGAFKSLERFVPILQHSIAETRSIYMGLRPTMLEEMGVIETLRWLCREFMDLYPKHHIELEMRVQEEMIQDPLKIAIFRITQEALNNICKHSKAEWVDLSLLSKGGGIELTIADDGIGVDLDSLLSSNSTARTLGLTGMKERTQLTGGTLSIESAPGRGTTIRAFWLTDSE
jgi:PAS domain S-box-containing protein